MSGSILNLNRIISIGSALFFVFVARCEGSDAVLQGVTFTSAKGYTRVTLSLSATSTYQTGVLKEREEEKLPPRIFIDLQEVRLGNVDRGPIRVQDGLLRQIRIGQFAKNVTRVVLDLESVVAHQSFTLLDPFRILIDVKGLSQEETAENKGYADPGARTVKKPKKTVIVIDPGHGGEDTGAIGWQGLREKDVVMALAKKLVPLLERGGKLKVVLTRSSDTFIPLENRTAIANANNADLFVSLHVNASTNPRAHGVETYYLDNTNDEAALRLAARENNTSKHRVDNLQFILSDLTQTHKLEDSISLANHLQSSLVGLVKHRHKGVKDLGVKKALFYVLVGAEMPCVLVEASFITNPGEGKRLVDPAYLEKIAQGLERGIRRYLSVGPRIKTL
jgi:N-acetylmuramoyl-L-alanine amidase